MLIIQLLTLIEGVFISSLDFNILWLLKQQNGTQQNLINLENTLLKITLYFVLKLYLKNCILAVFTFTLVYICMCSHLNGWELS